MTLHGAFDTLLVVLLISAGIWIRVLLDQVDRLSGQNRKYKDLINGVASVHHELGKLIPRKGKK